MVLMGKAKIYEAYGKGWSCTTLILEARGVRLPRAWKGGWCFNEAIDTSPSRNRYIGIRGGWGPRGTTVSVELVPEWSLSVSGAGHYCTVNSHNVWRWGRPPATGSLEADWPPVIDGQVP